VEVTAEWSDSKIFDIIFVRSIPVSVASKILRPLVHNLVNGEPCTPPVTLLNPESLDHIKAVWEERHP